MRNTRTKNKPTKIEAIEINARAVLDATVAEAELQRAIVDLAHTLGYRCYHQFDSRQVGGKRKNGQRTVDAGFPDWVFARDGRVIMAELKTKKGRLSADQLGWLAALGLGMGNIECYIWRPSDWSSGRIEAILHGVRLDRDGVA